MTHKWVEVTVRLVADDYKESCEVYCQRINYDYFQQAKPNMIAEIAAIVNDLRMPQVMHIPMSPDEINMKFDEQYALHKTGS